MNATKGYYYSNDYDVNGHLLINVYYIVYHIVDLLLIL